MSEALSETAQRLRELNAIEVQAVAAAAGVPVATILAIRSGHMRYPERETWDRILAALEALNG